MILGDFERVEALLQQAAELDPSSADLAYRRARVLADLERNEAAMVEFCRALDLGVTSIGITDARFRLNALSDQLRSRIPEQARVAFDRGIEFADDSLFVESVASFSTAIVAAPDWPEPLYNRAVVEERRGNQNAALRDFRAYLRLVAPDETDAILVSQRIGILEGAASVMPPNPMGALALGFIPGMGHFYTSRPVIGSVTLATAAAALIAGIGFRNITVLCLNQSPPGGVCPPLEIVDETTVRPYLLVGVGVGAAVTLIGAIDAYRKAKNRRSAFEEMRAPEAEPTFAAGLPTISTNGRQIDLNFLRLRFR
jgi:tetratricopeptide (TPR) repeat protein